ncbi:MAG: Amuc_1098 family type IV pilus outer membrane protein [Verrucomicrobiota bacterium]
MQKKPTYSSSPTAVSLILLAATMPFNISSAQSSGSGSGRSGLAQREIIRRQQAVAEADRLFLEGREAYAKADYQVAVDKYKQALGNVKDVPALIDRHESYTQHLADASVALAQSYRKVGKYDEARQLLEGVLAADVDPDNIIAKTELGYLDDPIRTNPALDYTHVKKVDEVRRKLYMAQGQYDLGKYDHAKKEYEDILRLDPFNEAARRGMEKIANTKSDYYRAAYDHTRAELLMQVDAAWELSVPAEIPTFNTTTDTTTSPSDGVAAITAKLRNIIIPRIDFEDRSVEEAIDYLRLRAAELDTTELDPAKKGVNLVIRRPVNNSIGGGEPAAEDAGGDLLGGGGGNLGALRIDELRLRNVPLAVALKYICDKTKLRYKVDDFAVTLVPMTEEGDDMFTRTFRVPPDFSALLSAGGEEGAAPVDDPFAAAGGAGGANQTLAARPPIIELLKRNGINFAEGSAATLGASGSLLVTNTPAELDKVEQLVELNSKGQPKQVKITTKFVEITQENSDELGFDWVISPIGGVDGNIFGTAGTLGNGAARTALDFINPVNGFPIDGIPTSSFENVSNTPTSGLRSGDYAISRSSIDAILNNPDRSSQNSSVAPGILGVTGLFSDGQVQMIMRGLAQKKGSDLMTAPSVTARSGQKATIEVIREFIYPTEYDPPEIGQVNVNNGNGGGGGGNQGGGGNVTPANPTAFETRNTGVTLEIEPTIGENDFVIDIRFLPQIVEFEGFVNYGSPILTPAVDEDGNPVTLTLTENRIEMPVFSKRSVDTSLTIYDGYTVAVGGLMREDVQIVEDKVPILGDIPVIGRLFQSEAENRIKSNLIIFVTAEIIDATGRRLRGDESTSPPPELADPTAPMLNEGVLPLPVADDALPIGLE